MIDFKNTKSLYLSPSRANLFYSDKKAFIDKYCFGIEKPASPAMILGKNINKALGYLFAEQPENIDEVTWPAPFIPFGSDEWCSPQSKARKADKKSIYLDENPLKCIKEAYFIVQNLKEFSHIKDICCDPKSEQEKEVTCDETRILGKTDFSLGSTAVELKTSSDLNSFNFNKFSYALQQVMYAHTSIDTLYFLFVQTSVPFNVKIISFEEKYLNYVNDVLMKMIFPQYSSFLKLYKEFLSKSKLTKEGLYNYLIDNYWITFNEMIQTKNWDMKEDV